MGGLAMARAKQVSRRKSRTKAVPALGAAAGLLSLAGGASATTPGPAADLPPQKIAPSHEITLGEEEISDVSLGTFYVFDKENAGAPPLAQQQRLARGGCGGCGGRGCGGCGGRGCGCGGCRCGAGIHVGCG